MGTHGYTDGRMGKQVENTMPPVPNGERHKQEYFTPVVTE